MIKREGIEYFLKLANGQAVKPANYYIGLCQEAEDVISKSAALADLTELTGNGYSRQAVAADAAGMVYAAHGDNEGKLTTAEVTFTAVGGDWVRARTMFLATTSDNSGKLVSTQMIESGAGVLVTVAGPPFEAQMTINGERGA
jgi:hypothetical protein